MSIARAIVNRPPLLVCDEPTGNLDPQTSRGIMDLLERINRTGTTVLVATHDRETVSYTHLGALALLATGFAKVMITPLCIRFGWRGGHFFPVIFAGVSIGYGMAALTGADPVFCLCACTAALVGAVMRQPLMAVLLLFLCFPVKGVVVMFLAAALGAAIPLPKALRKDKGGNGGGQAEGAAPDAGQGAEG